jgi:xanthosine utilization system XapX-like protein
MFSLLAGAGGILIILGAVTALLAAFTPASPEADDSGSFAVGVVGILMGVCLILAAWAVA